MTRFISKRNKVYVKDGLVFKEFENINVAKFEIEYLIRLKDKGVAVPFVVDTYDNTLVLEYIEGLTIPDFLESSDSYSRSETVSKHLADWFSCFYRAVEYETTSEIRGDVNGRNFIITDDQVFSVDFEEKIYGRMSTDLGRLLAFITTYTVKNTSAKDMLCYFLLDDFCSNLSIDSDSILYEKTKEMDSMKIRRKH